MYPMMEPKIIIVDQIPGNKITVLRKEKQLNGHRRPQRENRRVKRKAKKTTDI